MSVEATTPLPTASTDRLLGLQLIAACIFLATAGYTVYCTKAMAGGMEMPGGWTMSMMWMPMPGQTLAGAAGMFIGMWAAMMVAMMLPSAMPMILVYRRVATVRSMPDAGICAALVAAGYFAVWTALGAGVWVVGLVIARWEMSSDSLSRAVPTLGGVTLILCGAYQWTRWKSSCLRHCRDPLGMLCGHFGDGKWGAAKLGMHHGIFCAFCCSSLMVIQIVLGMMNLWVMAAIALVIALEKMLPRGVAVARVVGAISAATGLYMLSHTFFT